MDTKLLLKLFGVKIWETTTDTKVICSICNSSLKEIQRYFDKVLLPLREEGQWMLLRDRNVS